MGDDDGSETAASPVESDGSPSDDVQSRFEHLHDRFDERQREGSDSTAQQAAPSTDPFLPADRPATEPDSEDPNRTAESDAHTRFREFLADEDPPAAHEKTPSPTANQGNSIRLLYIGLILGVVLAMVLPGVVLASSAHVTDTVLAPSPTEYVDADDTLYLSTENAAYLSRVYEETTNEVAYCGLITHDEATPTVDVWMANTVNAGPDQVEFLTNNCPGEVREVLIHTHPSGSLSLSETDRQTLADRPEEIMCVQGGTLELDPGAELEDLACYRQRPLDENGVELSKIPIVISDDASDQ